MWLKVCSHISTEGKLSFISCMSGKLTTCPSLLDYIGILLKSDMIFGNKADVKTANHLPWQLKQTNVLTLII